MSKAKATAESAVKTDAMDLNLSPQELQAIKAQREKEKRKNECIDKINSLLKEYQASLIVSPNSPIGNPAIVIEMK